MALRAIVPACFFSGVMGSRGNQRAFPQAAQASMVN